MAAKPECLNLKEMEADVEYRDMELKFHNPVRMPAGKWRWPMQIVVTLELPDGRKLAVNETVIVTPKQIGRIPNPRAFGRATAQHPRPAQRGQRSMT